MQEEQDDIRLDTEEGIDDSVLEDENKGDIIKKLKEKVRIAEAKAKEHLDNWQRAQADFVNLRKRDEDAKVDFLKFAKSDMIREMIPVLDSFTQAFAHNQKEAEPIYTQLLQILKQNGLEESNPIGEAFNPTFHEAVGIIETDKKEDDHAVLEVFQRGYTLHGKVLRPAKVRIGEYKA